MCCVNEQQGRLSRAGRKSHTVVTEELLLMCELRMAPHGDRGGSSEEKLSSQNVFLKT